MDQTTRPPTADAGAGRAGALAAIGVLLAVAGQAVAQPTTADGTTKTLGGLVPAGLAKATDKDISKLAETKLPQITHDGGGYRWDIYQHGQVQRGERYAYAGGMNLYVDGQAYRNNSRKARALSQDDGQLGTEMLIGPINIKGLHVSRRIRVYKHRPMARWLEVLENRSQKPLKVSIRLQSHVQGSIQSKWFSSDQEKDKFTDEDWAFITHGHMRYGAPALLHLVCGRKAPVRPKVSISGNSIQLDYNELTIPAQSTVVLCHFESQNRKDAEHRRLLATFNPNRVLDDLGPQLRARVVNFPPMFYIHGVYDDVQFRRLPDRDTLTRDDGKRWQGRIDVQRFELQSRLGRLTVPAERVIGMRRLYDGEHPFAVVLTDGQVLAAQLLHKEIPIRPHPDQVEAVEVAHLDQLAFGETDGRPSSCPFQGPYAMLRSGDKLRIEPDSFQVDLATRLGRILPSAEELVVLELAGGSTTGHRAVFQNGSSLNGLISERRVRAKLTLGPELSVTPAEVLEIRYAAAPLAPAYLTRLETAGGDVLRGELADESLAMVSPFGEYDLRVADLHRLSFDPSRLRKATVETWDRSSMQANLRDEAISFRVTDRILLSVPACQCVAIDRSQPERPGAILDRARTLVGQIRTTTDLDDAAPRLRALGSAATPLLRRRAEQVDDMELRRQLTDLAEQLAPRPIRLSEPPEDSEQDEQDQEPQLPVPILRLNKGF
jgi:hypothetical protein